MGRVFVALVLGLILARSSSAQVVQASLVGTRESMVRQNEMATEEDLSRLHSKNLILKFTKMGALVPLSRSSSFAVESNLPYWRRVARPWVVNFLSELGDSLRAKHNETLLVSSCIRDARTQRRLRRQLGKGAARSSGSLQSTHFTGATCDISQKYLSTREKSFIRSRLLVYEKLCMVEATEHGSRRNRHFHVYVSKRFEDGDICIPEFTMPKIELKLKFNSKLYALLR